MLSVLLKILGQMPAPEQPNQTGMEPGPSNPRQALPGHGWRRMYLHPHLCEHHRQSRSFSGPPDLCPQVALSIQA